MLEIYYGDNRIKAEGAIKKTLGSGYEVIDGAELKTDDLPNIFMGTSLFTSERAILIKDLGENTEVWNKLINYIDTSNKVIIWEQKLDKRTAAYKELAKAGVKMVEFALTEAPEAREVFNILDTAWHDGKKAVLKLEKIEMNQDPYMFVGLMVTQAIKKFEYRQGSKEKRVLKELSKLDIRMKSTSMQPWSLVKSFLLQVSSW